MDCVNEESIGFSQEVFLSDVHGGERHNNYINTINPGETVTVRMAFKVPEEKLNEMYFTLSNYVAAISMMRQAYSLGMWISDSRKFL